MSERVPLSIIVITHERQLFAIDAVESVVRERERYDGECEIILVDSSQEPVSVPDEINHLHSPELISAAEKRNAGVNAADHEWVVFMDDDCVMAAKTLSAIADGIKRASEDVAGFVGVTKFDGPRSIWFDAMNGTDFTTDFEWAKDGGEVRWAPTSMAIFKKSAFLAVNGFDEEISAAGGEDVDLCIRLRQTGLHLVGVPNAKAYHTTETWNTPSDNLHRVFRYGLAESKLMERYPDHILPARLSKVTAGCTAGATGFLFAAGHLGPVTSAASFLLLVMSWSLGKATIDYFRYPLSPVQALVLTIYRFGYETGSVYQKIRHGPRVNLLRRLDWWFGISDDTWFPNWTDGIRWLSLVFPLAFLFSQLIG